MYLVKGTAVNGALVTRWSGVGEGRHPTALGLGLSPSLSLRLWTVTITRVSQSMSLLPQAGQGGSRQLELGISLLQVSQAPITQQVRLWLPLRADLFRKKRVLWPVLKWCLFSAPCWQHKGLFSDAVRTWSGSWR